MDGAVCVWCWDSVGEAVDVPTQRYSTYPHQIPTQHQVFPPTAYARLASPHFHHLAQTHTHHTYPTFIPPNSTPRSTLLQTRPTPTSQPDPTTPPYPPHILSYPPNPHPSYPYMPTPPQRLSSVLARRICR